MTDWRDKVEDLLSEEIGMLATVVIDEVLAELKVSEATFNGHLSGKFVRLLERKTKNDVNNPKVLRDIYKVLLEIPY